MYGKHLAKVIRFRESQQTSSETEQWETTIYSLRGERNSKSFSHLNRWIFLDVQKPKKSLLIKSCVQCHYRHISPRKAQLSQRLFGFELIEFGGQVYQSSPYNTCRSGTRSRPIAQPKRLRPNRGLTRLISDQALGDTLLIVIKIPNLTQ